MTFRKIPFRARDKQNNTRLLPASLAQHFGSRKLMASHKRPNIEGIQVRHTTWQDVEGKALRARQLEEFLNDFGDEPVPPTSTSRTPVFLVLEKDGRSIACGGFLPLNRKGDANAAAELRRMYVVPEYRGKKHGVADLLLQRLEQLAFDHGHVLLRLETGEVLHRARQFYERHGFKQIPLYGEYAGMESSVCYEKDLREGRVDDDDGGDSKTCC